MEGWRAALLAKFEFAFASILLVAGPNVYQTYGVWYEMHQGFIDCPTQPETCCTPSSWYPQLSKQLGAPLGRRAQVAAYHWTREFEHAHVEVDFTSPNGAKIVFNSEFNGTGA